VRPVGIVTGLALEAWIARRAGGLTGVAAPGVAENAAEALVARGAAALVSFGIAGGLDPRLATGAIVIGRAVAAGAQERVLGDAAWAERLGARLPGASLGMIHGCSDPLGAIEEKSSAFTTTGALAVDMESHTVAGVAARHGLPFVALRVVADPAGVALPDAALAGFTAGSGVAPGGVLASLAHHPGQIGALIAVAGRTATALLVLTRCAEALRDCPP
jgi:hypothetical protein